LRIVLSIVSHDIRLLFEVVQSLLHHVVLVARDRIHQVAQLEAVKFTERVVDIVVEILQVNTLELLEFI
jgi:hypothetical protein